MNVQTPNGGAGAPPFAYVPEQALINIQRSLIVGIAWIYVDPPEPLLNVMLGVSTVVPPERIWSDATCSPFTSP